MVKHFNDSTLGDIDAKLCYDSLRHDEQVNRCLIIIVCILIFIFRGFIGYWLKFGIAIPSGIATKPVDVRFDPVQTNYNQEEINKKTFVYTSLINNHKIILIPQAHYELSGFMVAKNHDFLFISDFFDSAALFDMGAAWGEIGKKPVYKKYFKSYSAKTELTGSRILWIQGVTSDCPYDKDYIVSHFSHSHIVPANRNVMAALLKINKYTDFKIEGELVDMQYKNSKGRIENYHTSMSRNDTMPGDRGSGNCETVYVTKVQIGNLIYK